MRASIPFAAAAAFLALCGPTRADVPRVFSFQGLLTNAAGRPVSDGAHAVRFLLYNGPNADQSVADEAHVTTNPIHLAHSAVVPSSEVVKSQDGTITYTRGTAYTMDYDLGTITPLSVMPLNQNVKVSYQWRPTAYWTEDQTVTTAKGLFSALLGTSSALHPLMLTGDDWLEIQVRDGGAETLAPRLRVPSAPFALRVGTVDGALGGTVNGGVNATASVSGTAQSTSVFGLPITMGGVVGQGVSGSGGEAAGVVALGANRYSLALSVTGKASVDGSLEVKGSTLLAQPVVAPKGYQPRTSCVGSLEAGATSTTVTFTGVDMYSSFIDVREQVGRSGVGYTEGPPESFTWYAYASGSDTNVVVTRKSGVAGALAFRARVW